MDGLSLCQQHLTKRYVIFEIASITAGLASTLPGPKLFSINS